MKNFILISIFTAISSFSFSQNQCAGQMTYYSIEECMDSPKDVVTLDIALNKLVTVSPDIGKLENLVCLDLSFNRFSTLPDEFGNLKKLKFLNLTGTRHMAKLPEVLKELTSLEVLDLRDHPEWTPAMKEAAVEFLPNVKVLIK